MKGCYVWIFCSCSEQLYRRLWVAGCQYVRVCVCDAFFTMFLSYTRHWSYEMLVACTISGEKAYHQGHSGHSVFLWCPLRGSIPIRQTCFILCTNIVHDVTMCRDSFPGQKVQGLGHIGHLKWRSHGSFEVFVMSALWFSPYLTESLHMCYACNTWGVMYCAPFSGRKVKGQGHMGHFKFWPCPLHGSLFDQITSYVAYIQHMRGRCVAHHFQDEKWKVKVTWVVSSFCRVYFVASS